MRCSRAQSVRALQAIILTEMLAFPYCTASANAAMLTVMAERARGSANSLDSSEIAVAIRIRDLPAKDGFPSAAEWNAAPSVRFNTDWQGLNPDPQRETQVRLLWTPEELFLRFEARYRGITVFADSDPNGRRDQLWDGDVAEVFLQPDSSDPLQYEEFEVSPNGMWIDLQLSHGERRDLGSGLRRRTIIDEAWRTWTAELALPMSSLTLHFDPTTTWRVNFFRVEGAAEPRFYSAWRPTGTPEPNFHVPAAFGKLVFAEKAR
jgi:alpha-galactosidase